MLCTVLTAPSMSTAHFGRWDPHPANHTIKKSLLHTLPIQSSNKILENIVYNLLFYLPFCST